MKKVNLMWLCLCLNITLAGCGENFSAANVSLGGSGTGDVKSPLPGGGSNPDGKPTEDNEEKEYYYATIPAMVNNECLGVQRTMYFVYAESKQPISVGSVEYLPFTNLKLEVENRTPRYVFELAPQCRSFEVKSEDRVYSKTPYPICAENQNSVQVLQPYETRAFTFDLNFINASGLWSVAYQVSSSAELPNLKTTWEKCAPLRIPITIQKKIPPTSLEDNLQRPTDANINSSALN